MRALWGDVKSFFACIWEVNIVIKAWLRNKIFASFFEHSDFVFTMATKTRKMRCCRGSGRVTLALYYLLLLESILTVLVRGTTSQTTKSASDDWFALLRNRDGGLSLSGGSLQKERRNPGGEDFHSKIVLPRASHTSRYNKVTKALTSDAFI